jgi:hypothetical protein
MYDDPALLAGLIAELVEAAQREHTSITGRKRE